jgi:integrase
MPRGAAVIRREGKRDATYSLKFTDAAGRQVWERLGLEREGWSRTKAERELGKRLELVERDRWRKPERITFDAFARRFLADYLPGRNLKPSTVSDYGSIIGLATDDAPARGLCEFFGAKELATIEPSDVDAYISHVTPRLAPKTVGNHLGLLRVMFRVARRWKLVVVNPVIDAERPRVEQAEMQVLSEAEIARLVTAYRELQEEHREATEAEWWPLTRRLVEVALGTAMRRGELLALRWRDVELLERRLHVRESYVRGEFVSPKSRASRRTLTIGPRTAAVLDEQFKASRYRTDDSLVFCHPILGTPLDPSKLSRDFMRPALAKAKITKPFRPWHDLRHTALTHEAAAGNPAVYVQLKAGHSQGSITERYIHAAQVMFPGAAERGEDRLFGTVA